MACALGAIVAAAVAVVSPWQLTLVVGWSTAAIAFVAWTWATIGRRDPDSTRTHAREEDNSRDATRLLLSSAAVASLVGVALALFRASKAGGALAVLLTVGAVVTVVASWAVVHTLYTLRYARLYYDGEAGGIDFKTDDDPDYLDFAYLAFTVGMTFQVSDTDVQNRALRRTVLKHALLSYLFGTVIIAVTINVVAGLVR